MADSILRLKVESQEYDAKLKRAADGLQRYADECRKVGGTMEKVEKDTLDYVRAIGKMETTSRSATGKLSEMRKAFVELSMQYQQLTDKEKQSPFGKALAQSLEQLKGRINESKQQLDEINKSIGGTGGGGGLSGALDTLESKFGMSIKSIGLWGAALGAGKVALDVMKDAFFANETQLDEWGRTVQSCQSLYDGFLNALNTGDISGYFSSMNEIVNAARDAYDAMDTLATYNAFTRGKRAGLRSDYSEALNAYKLNPTAENKKALEEANKALVESMQQQADLIKQDYEKSLRSLGIDRLLKGDQLNEFMSMFRSGDWEKLEAMKGGYKQGKLLDAGSEYWYSNRVWDGKIKDRFSGKWRPMGEDEKKNFEFARVLSQINDSQIDAVQALDEQYKNTLDAINNQNRSYNRLAGNNASPTRGTVSPTRGTGGNTVVNVPGSVADLNAQIAELRKQQQQVTDFAGWEKYDKQIHDITLRVKELKGELGLDAIGKTLGSVKAASISGLTQEYDWAKGREDLIKRGDKQIRNFKGVQQDKTEVIMTKELGKITSGVQGIFSGMEALGVELPQGLKDLMGGVQGIISILSGIATVVSAIQAISTADLIKPLAGGGIVGRAASGLLVGNHMSGDRLRMPVIGGGMVGLNDGELILNKAQQGVVASYMNDGGGGGNAFQPYVSGQYVYLGTNNYLKASGQGEIVTTKMLKRYGLV